MVTSEKESVAASFSETTRHASLYGSTNQAEGTTPPPYLPLLLHSPAGENIRPSAQAHLHWPQRAFLNTLPVLSSKKAADPLPLLFFVPPCTFSYGIVSRIASQNTVHNKDYTSHFLASLLARLHKTAKPPEMPISGGLFVFPLHSPLFTAKETFPWQQSTPVTFLRTHMCSQVL